MTNLTRLILAHARYGKDSNPRPRGPTPDDKAGIDVDSVGEAMALEFAIAVTLRSMWTTTPARWFLSTETEPRFERAAQVTRVTRLERDKTK